MDPPRCSRSRSLLAQAPTRTVDAIGRLLGYDETGIVLAVANALGLAAVGVDLSLKRCRAARNLVLGRDARDGRDARVTRVTTEEA